MKMKCQTLLGMLLKKEGYSKVYKVGSATVE